MQLTEREKEFIAKREKLIRLWPSVGSGLGITVITLTAWLYYRTPLLIDPITAMASLSEGSVPETTMMLMAGMLPLVFLACLGLLVMIILFVTAMIYNEKKYLKIIGGLAENTNNEKSPSS